MDMHCLDFLSCLVTTAYVHMFDKSHLVMDVVKYQCITLRNVLRLVSKSNQLKVKYFWLLTSRTCQ